MHMGLCPLHGFAYGCILELALDRRNQSGKIAFAYVIVYASRIAMAALRWFIVPE